MYKKPEAVETGSGRYFQNGLVYFVAGSGSGMGVSAAGGEAGTVGSLQSGTGAGGQPWPAILLHW